MIKPPMEMIIFCRVYKIPLEKREEICVKSPHILEEDQP